jgi:hypothetical protein
MAGRRVTRNRATEADLDVVGMRAKHQEVKTHDYTDDMDYTDTQITQIMRNAWWRFA